MADMRLKLPIRCWMPDCMAPITETIHIERGHGQVGSCAGHADELRARLAQRKRKKYRRGGTTEKPE